MTTLTGSTTLALSEVFAEMVIDNEEKLFKERLLISSVGVVRPAIQVVMIVLHTLERLKTLPVDHDRCQRWLTEMSTGS